MASSFGDRSPEVSASGYKPAALPATLRSFYGGLLRPENNGDPKVAKVTYIYVAPPNSRLLMLIAEMVNYTGPIN